MHRNSSLLYSSLLNKSNPQETLYLKLKEAKFKINPDGTVSDQVDNLEITIKAIELAEKHIKKVDLTVKETGDKIKTVDQMQFSPYCEECLTEIGFLVLNGPQLGKR